MGQKKTIHDIISDEDELLSDAFYQLNTAFTEDGLYLEVAKKHSDR